jgi:hypothetical protein
VSLKLLKPSGPVQGLLFPVTDVRYPNILGSFFVVPAKTPYTQLFKSYSSLILGFFLQQIHENLIPASFWYLNLGFIFKTSEFKLHKYQHGKAQWKRIEIKISCDTIATVYYKFIRVTRT